MSSGREIDAVHQDLRVDIRIDGELTEITRGVVRRLDHHDIAWRHGKRRIRLEAALQPFDDLLKAPLHLDDSNRARPSGRGINKLYLTTNRLSRCFDDELNF